MDTPENSLISPIYTNLGVMVSMVVSKRSAIYMLKLFGLRVSFNVVILAKTKSFNALHPFYAHTKVHLSKQHCWISFFLKKPYLIVKRVSTFELFIEV
jgi:hypothetical protein